MAATQVQTIAAKTIADHSDSPSLLRDLADLAGGGSHLSNAHRDLQRYAERRCCQTPDPVDLNLPMKFKRFKLAPGVDVSGNHAIAPPFAWFSFLYQTPTFRARFLGGREGNIGNVLAAFWASVPDSDGRKIHLRSAFKKRPDYTSDLACFRRAVPLTFHGDGVPVARMTLNNCSWSGFLGQALPTMDSKILISGLINRTIGPRTKAAYWDIIAWSLLALWEGKFPKKDYQGNDWKYGNPGEPLVPDLHLFGTIWTVKGDMEWLANVLGLEHTSSHTMCPWCMANDLDGQDEELAMSSIPWNDIGPRAAWRSTIHSSADAWLIYHGGRDAIHPLLALPGVSGLNVMADAMHIIDLGVSHHVIGNVLFKLCWEDRYFAAARTPQNRLDMLWTLVEQIYIARGVSCRIGEMSLGHFTDTRRPHLTYPSLSTRIKAAETRHFLPVLLSIFSDRCNLAIAEDSHMLQMLRGLDAAYTVLNSNVEHKLPPAEVAEFQRGIEACLQHYRWLHADANDRNKLWWQEVPKHHYVQHISAQAAFQNPRYSWNYSDEDFMGCLKRICESCLSGTQAHRVVAKLVRKWAAAVSMRMLFM